jgi:MYXO-CTERM domain-containing protein
VWLNNKIRFTYLTLDRGSGMPKQWMARLALGVLLTGVKPALAMPLVSIDLDPATPGIQDTLSIDAGNSFTVNMVLSVTGAPVAMDTVLFETVFNSAGPVLGLSGGAPTAGALAGAVPIALDAYSAFLLLPGAAMATAAAPYTPAAGFAGQSGGHGMLLLGAPPVLGEFSFYSLTFDALVPGTSEIAPSAGAGLPLEGGIGFLGTVVPFDIASATVTVTDPGIQLPEPSILALFGLGLLGLRRFSRRR